MDLLAKKQKLSNEEVIRELFNGERQEDQLTDPQREYLDIIRVAYAMIMEVKSKSFIVKALMDQFSISQQKAYRLINASGRIFGDINKVDKIVYQNMAIEMAKASYRLALEKENTMAMVQATKALMTAAGIDKDDAELPDFTKLTPHLNVLVLPDGMEDTIKQVLQEGAVNLNTFPTQDVKHEELSSRQLPADQKTD